MIRRHGAGDGGGVKENRGGYPVIDNNAII
jgi:hypothetical protein